MEFDRLTNSAVGCLRQCLRKFYFRFILGIGRLKTAGALRIGGAFHKGAELWQKGMPPEQAIAEAVKGYDTIPEWADAYEHECERAVVRAMLRSYTEFYAGDKIEFVEVELPFDVPLVNPETGGKSKTFTRAGKIDGIIRLNGQLMLFEIKTTSDPVDPASEYWRRLRVDPQPSHYILAARELGFDVQSVIYSVAHKPSMRPSSIALLDEDGVKVVLNAAGERVRTKDGKKFRETGDAALGYVLQTRPETPDEYEARIYADMKARPDFYLARREIPRLENDLNEYKHEIWDASQLILNCRRNNIWIRSVSKANCSNCEFNDACLECVKIDENNIPAGMQKLPSLYPELEEAMA